MTFKKVTQGRQHCVNCQSIERVLPVIGVEVTVTVVNSLGDMTAGSLRRLC